MTTVPIRRALISLSDKAGLETLAAGLAKHGVELVSTGGHRRQACARLGHAVRDVAELTGFPEMMDGRVKTLHPKVHGALLGVRDNQAHVAAMDAHGIAPIDLVVVNLYPFEATVAKGADRDTIIENIDIGGPSMVRSAAKNHAHVAIVTDPADYATLLEQLDAEGGTDLAFRRKLAAKAYALTASYDSMISQWFAFADQGERFPPTLALTATRADELRYGENPHQHAALYLPSGPAWAGDSAGRAGAGQGAELQQHQRRRCRARTGRRVSRWAADGGDRQACQPVRSRERRDAGRGLCRGPGLRQRVGVRRDYRGQPAPRWSDRRGDQRDLYRGGGRAGGR